MIGILVHDHACDRSVDEPLHDRVIAQMGARTDRWINRILALPVFDAPFNEALWKTPLSSLAFVSAMEARSGAEFAAKALTFAEEIQADVLNVFQGREIMLEQFWTLTCSVERAYFESTACQLGFGLCDRTPLLSKGDPSAALRKQSAIANLLQQKAPKRAKVVASDSSSSAPLLDKERNLKWKWAARLEEIAKRAGPFSRLFQEQELGTELTPGERLQLKAARTCGRGSSNDGFACSDVRENGEVVRSLVFEFIYPLSIDRALKYSLFLNERDWPIGAPFVESSGQVGMLQAGYIDPPDFEDPRFTSRQKEVETARAKTLKEAVPIPIGVVKVLEECVVRDGSSTSPYFCLVAFVYDLRLAQV